ncbi:MAG: ABC transporter permease [Oscillospiraceae bacterium]|nr:ABC transporter permease [Oscillospiraceae bacterium]
MNKEIKKNISAIQFWGLIKWSLTRNKYLIPAFCLIQVILAFAIVYGFALMNPVIDYQSSVYMASGALVLGIIAVGCVLAPQIISDSRQNGILAYQRTLPVSRVSIILADVIIWSIAAIPGIVMSCLAGIIRFDIEVNVNIISIVIILICLISMILIGFGVAYFFPPNATSLCTQVIMIGALLFSPITYPADRLPDWVLKIHDFLPFVAASDLIRASVFDLQEIYVSDLIVILLWATIAFVTSLKIVSKKE